MKIIPLMLFTVSMISSCKEKEINEEIIVRQSIASETQRIALNLEKDSIIHGKEGTILIFPLSCLNQDTGIVIVKLQEYYNLPDMLLGNLTTTSGQRILETDGMINIAIETETGQEVFIREGKLLQVQMPKTKEDMSLFYGKMKNDKIDWEISDIKQSSSDTMPTYQKDGTYNYFETIKLGWINADKFIDINKKNNLTIYLPEYQLGVNCYLVLKEYNSILPGIVAKGKVTFEGIPANTTATLISLGVNEQSQFFSMKEVNTNDKFVQLSALQAMSTKEIKSILEKKFGRKLTGQHPPAPARLHRVVIEK